jgi:hypothetical protein
MSRTKPSRRALFGKELSRLLGAVAGYRRVDDEPEIGRVLDREGVVFELYFAKLRMANSL